MSYRLIEGTVQLIRTNKVGSGFNYLLIERKLLCLAEVLTKAGGAVFFPLSDEISKLFTSAPEEVESIAAREQQPAAGAKQLAFAIAE